MINFAYASLLHLSEFIMKFLLMQIEQSVVRESNIELLRIISMILVLLSHASYTSLTPPTIADISTSLDSAFLRVLAESFSVVCVNLFVLISGWYGIKVRWSRFAELIFRWYSLAFPYMLS